MDYKYEVGKVAEGTEKERILRLFQKVVQSHKAACILINTTPQDQITVSLGSLRAPSLRRKEHLWVAWRASFEKSPLQIIIFYNTKKDLHEFIVEGDSP